MTLCHESRAGVDTWLLSKIDYYTQRAWECILNHIEIKELLENIYCQSTQQQKQKNKTHKNYGFLNLIE